MSIISNRFRQIETTVTILHLQTAFLSPHQCLRPNPVQWCHGRCNGRTCTSNHFYQCNIQWNEDKISGLLQSSKQIISEFMGFRGAWCAYRALGVCEICGFHSRWIPRVMSFMAGRSWVSRRLWWKCLVFPLICHIEVIWYVTQSKSWKNTFGEN